MKKLSLLVVVLAMAGAACAPKKTVKNSDKDKAAQAKADSDAAYTPDVDAVEASIHGKEFAAVEGLDAIRFDYDSANLSQQALDTLKKNADYLKAHPDQDVLVAGFCDERGTIEYNMALGQKRAKQVREYYIRLGVNGKQVGTISYGKEMGVCSESTESCWAQNRRAETRLRVPTAANGSSKALPQ